MAQKSTQLYDFTLAAFGSQVILADANFYKILTSTGDVQITRDGGSRIRPMRAGRGEREVNFLRLQITDISGAPNSGTIVVGDSNFIDDTIVLSSSINVRPEAPSGFYSASTAMTANTAVQIFSAASNTGGALVLNAGCFIYTSAAGSPEYAMLYKPTAPADPADGAMVFMGVPITAAANYYSGGRMDAAQFVPAGQGLWEISSLALVAGQYNKRHCRYKLL